MEIGLVVTAALIGVVEGLTEFLPISSTAHIRISELVLGFRDHGETFTVVIQLGAILAVVAYYWRRWAALAVGCVRGERASWRFVLGLALASLPPAALGLLLNDWLEQQVFGAYEMAVIASTMLLGGLAILAVERWRPPPRHQDAGCLPPLTCLWIGLLQVLAMIPGVSRSGASIIGAMCVGVERRAATEFSFFLAIPIMLGASGLKLAKHHAAVHGDFALALLVGFAVSFVVALAAVHWLLAFVATHTFRPFAWYRIAVGLLLLGLLALGVLPLRVD
ncbi:MAG: undecaprenyl-diphosphate phosphatase [Planctomycetota bacterium]|nr:undecaprenyl-diphosphate phosphatase [Planctomycetota bacterium]